MEQAFAGLKNVKPNSGKDERQYTGKESDYTRLLKDAEFWKREAVTECTYQTAMKHRQCTLQRFSLLKQGESLKDIKGKRGKNFRNQESCQRRCLLSEIIVLLARRLRLL